MTSSLVREIHTTVSQLRKEYLTTQGVSERNSLALLDILDQIKQLAEAERVTQESIDELTHAIAGLPMESRGLLIDFLNNMAAGTWTAALLEAVRAAAA